MSDRDDILVRCVGAGRTYGAAATAVHAVVSATASVRRDDQIAITGPSGSGKSTLLHMLAGLEPPTSGHVDWPALDPDPIKRHRQIGVVFQADSLLAPLDVLENVMLPLLVADVPEREARARAANSLHALRIGELSAALPEELSGGQAQRVAVARVMSMRPALILADEPTGQLDSAHAQVVVDALQLVARTLHAGLVVATHDESVAGQLITRWPMSDGRLQLADEVTR